MYKNLTNNQYAVKCLECNTIISGITVGSTRHCNCKNRLTVHNLMGRYVLKAEDFDYVMEKSKESILFTPLVY